MRHDGTVCVARFGPAEGIPWWTLLWIVLFLIAAALLYVAARDSFVRCLGRASETPGRPITGRKKEPAAEPERGL